MAIINILIFTVVLAFLILTHELGHFIAARLCGVKVDRFAIGFGPVVYKKQLKETLLLIHAIPFGGYVSMAGEHRATSSGQKHEFYSKPVGLRALVVFFGPMFNYLISFLLLWFLFIVGMPQLGNLVGGIVEDSPAQAAGFQEDDRIIKINDNVIEDWKDIQKSVENLEGTLTFTVERDEKQITLVVTAKPTASEDMYKQKVKKRKIGIYPGEVNSVKYGFFMAGIKGGERVWDLTKMTLKGFYLMITGKLSAREGLAGPIDIFRITSDTAKTGGFLAILHLIALLGVSLAIVNLFPVPVLDGGHLLFFLFEKIRGKPLTDKVETILFKIGWSLLITLMVFVIYNDIMKRFDEIKIKKDKQAKIAQCKENLTECKDEESDVCKEAVKKCLEEKLVK